MPVNKRQSVAAKSGDRDNNNNNDDDDDDDDKLQKQQSQNHTRFCRKAGLVSALFVALLVLQVASHVHESKSKDDKIEASSSSSSSKKFESPTSKSSNNDIGNEIKEYELYPFLVDSAAVTTSAAAAAAAPTASAVSLSLSLLLSKPTLPSFPIISRLEDCTLSASSFVPSNNPPRKEQAEWRNIFWIPSFPGSGASNPTRKGDLLRQLIEGLFTGDSPVKDFHASKGKRLKRCIGVSETIGCTNNHPFVPINPETQTQHFRPEVIVPIRNPATAIPEYFTNKNIAYHKATRQGSEQDWRKMRDAFFEESFQHWMEVIRYWRRGSTSTTSTSTSKEEPSYYQTALYVPFEDLVTSDAAKGTEVVQRLANLLNGSGSGYNNKNDNKNGTSTNTSNTNTTTTTTTTMTTNNTLPDYFETTKSRDDYECLWYRTAKQEWEREQQIIVDYIPTYTKGQKNIMVQNLTSFADEIENYDGNGDDSSADSILVSLLRRYAYQIEHYVTIDVDDEDAAAEVTSN